MSRLGLFFGTLLPTLAVGITLIALCFIAAIALAAETTGFPQGSAALRISIWSGIVLGGTVGCAGIVLAIRTGRAIQHTQEEMSRRVELAAERIGCQVGSDRSDTNDIMPGLQKLLDAIDGVIDEGRQREREVL